MWLRMYKIFIQVPIHYLPKPEIIRISVCDIIYYYTNAANSSFYYTMQINVYKSELHVHVISIQERARCLIIQGQI